MKHNLNSTALRTAEYEDGNLTVEFNDDRSATYVGVPNHVFEELLRSPSQGRYFNMNIRGQYDEK